MIHFNWASHMRTRSRCLVLAQSAALFLSLAACQCWGGASATALSDDTASGCGAPHAILQELLATPDSLTLSVGERSTVRVVGRDQFGAQMTVSSLDWESDDPAIAAVDGSGVVTGITAGATSVTAASPNGKRVLVPVHVLARAP